MPGPIRPLLCLRVLRALRNKKFVFGDLGTGYTCPACGARLGEAADVSPKGDVKCGYCRQWFNIHG
jgi:hypothetical protein